jgi:hypothetical protein
MSRPSDIYASLPWMDGQLPYLFGARQNFGLLKYWNRLSARQMALHLATVRLATSTTASRQNNFAGYGTSGLCACYKRQG